MYIKIWYICNDNVNYIIINGGVCVLFFNIYMYLCRVFWDVLVVDLSIFMLSISVD